MPAAAVSAVAAAVAEEKEREKVEGAGEEKEEDDDVGNDHVVVDDCNAKKDEMVILQNAAIMLPLEDKEVATVVASSEKPDRADLFYSAKKPRQRSSMSSRRQTCNVDDLQALLQEFGQSPVGDSIVVSDIDEEMEAGEEENEGAALILLSPCNENHNKENDNTMMKASSARVATPSARASP